MTRDLRRAQSLKEKRSTAPTTAQSTSLDQLAPQNRDKPLPAQPKRHGHRHADSDPGITAATLELLTSDVEPLRRRLDTTPGAYGENRKTVGSIYSQDSAASESVLAVSAQEQSADGHRISHHPSNRASSPTGTIVTGRVEPPEDDAETVRLRRRRYSKHGSDYYTDSHCSVGGGQSPMTPVDPGFNIKSGNLDEVFPSILKPYRLMRALPKDDFESLSRLPALAEVFDGCLTTVIGYLGGVPQEVQATTTYQNALSGLQFSRNMFMAQVGALKTDSVRQSIVTVQSCDDIVSLTEELLDETMRSLRGLLGVVNGVMNEEPGDLDSLLEETADTEPARDDSSVDQDVKVQECVAGTSTHTLAVPRISVAYASTVTLAVPDDTHQAECDPSAAETQSTTDTLRPSHAKGKMKEERPISLAFTDDMSVISTEAGDEVPALPASVAGWRNKAFGAPLLGLKSSQSTLALKTSKATPNGIRFSLYQFPNLFTADGDIAELAIANGDITLGDDGSVTTATFPALVRVLTSTRDLVDYDFNEIFFLAFRLFSTPTQLYNELVQRYCVKPPPGLAGSELTQWRKKARATKLRVARALHSWAEFYWRAEYDKDITMKLVNFAFGRISKDFRESSKDLVDSLHKCACAPSVYKGRQLQVNVQALEATMNTDMAQERFPGFGGLFAKGHVSNIPETSNIHPFSSPRANQELAEQLTVLESSLYRAVDPFDLLRYSVKKESLPAETRQTIKRVTDCSNALMEWTKQTIRAAETPAQMAEIYEFFALLGTNCVKLRNFQSAMSIWGGLSALRQKELADIMKLVSVTSHNYFASMARLFGHGLKLTDYIEALNRENRPAVPYLGLFANDLVRIYEHPKYSTEPSESGEEMINVLRLRGIARVFREIEKYHVPYKLHANENIQQYLASVLEQYKPDESS